MASKSNDRAILKAFSEGHKDGFTKRNPYAPYSDQAKWEAWNIGAAEADPKYVASSNG